MQYIQIFKKVKYLFGVFHPPWRSVGTVSTWLKYSKVTPLSFGEGKGVSVSFQLLIFSLLNNLLKLYKIFFIYALLY